MSARLPRLQASLPISDSAGRATNPFSRLWDQLCSSAEHSINGLEADVALLSSTTIFPNGRVLGGHAGVSVDTSVAGSAKIGVDVPTALGFNPARFDLTNVSVTDARDLRLVIGGDRSRRLGEVLSDAADVNNYLNLGDTNYDGAISRALAATGKAYFPSTVALGGSVFVTTATITLGPSQELIGDGSSGSTIQCNNPAVPVVTVAPSQLFLSIRGLTLQHRRFGATGTTHTSTSITGLSVNPILAGWTVGMPISGSGIPAPALVGGVPTPTTITALTSNSITISAPTTASAAGVALIVLGCTSTGHGVSMGQGLLDWVNNGFLDDVQCIYNWVGWNLGKAFSCTGYDCQASGNAVEGFKHITTGNATGFAGAVVGPLQWVWVNPASGSNGWDGYSYGVTGTGFGGSGVGSSLGTLYNPVTFANGHHGLAFYGSAAQPLNSVRVLGGFIGEDKANGIYLDTYARDHVVKPDFTELAGNYNICITANNLNTVVEVGQCGGAFWDGLFSEGDNTKIIGGNFVNNGLAGTGVDNWAGIIINNGSATVTGVTSRNWIGTFQQFGIRTAVDTLVITGCRLDPPGTVGSNGATINGALVSAANTGNNLAPLGGVALVNSVVSGCFPSSINVYGDVRVHSLGVNVAPTGTAGDITTTTLHVSGSAAFAGGVNVTGVGINVSAGAGGLVVDNIQARVSLGVGTAAPGTAGTIAATAGLFSGGLTANALTSNNFVAMNGALTGATSISMAGALTGATSGSFSSAVSVGSLSSSGAVSGTTITASTDLVSNGTAHFNGAAAFTSGGIFVTGGSGLNMSVGAGGIITDNIQSRNSLGVGTTANGGAGRSDIAYYEITTPTVVASLPAAAGRGGARAFVTDGTVGVAAGIGSVVAGGGTLTVPVFCDGANWRVG